MLDQVNSCCEDGKRTAKWYTVNGLQRRFGMVWPSQSGRGEEIVVTKRKQVREAMAVYRYIQYASRVDF